MELISKEVVRRIIDSGRTKEQMLVMVESAVTFEECDDCISRSSIKQKLIERHDFFIKAYCGFSNLLQNDKSRVDEISNCIAMVVNEPSVKPKDDFEEVAEDIDMMEEDIDLACDALVEDDDCISREAAIEIIESWLSCDDYNEAERHIMRAMQSVLYDLPPVAPQPKQRTGEWQRMSDLSEAEDDRYQCSRCGNVVHFSRKVNLYTFSRWCGRCGSNNDGR